MARRPCALIFPLNTVWLVLQVGSTLFVHGGVLPQHVSHGFDKINR